LLAAVDDRPFPIPANPDGDGFHLPATALQTIARLDVQVTAPETIRAMIPMFGAVGIGIDRPAALLANEAIIAASVALEMFTQWK
jgi:hypothetical protein